MLQDEQIDQTGLIDGDDENDNQEEDEEVMRYQRNEMAQ